MITIDLSDLELETLTEFEFVVKGKRCITLSFNDTNFALQISGGVKPESISNSESSFFLRAKDF